MTRPRKKSNEELDEIEQFLDTETAKVAEQEPRVNALTRWLTERRLSNGFGEDFEWTLANPRRSGG